jgi:hypothetical protein
MKIKTEIDACRKKYLNYNTQMSKLKNLRRHEGRTRGINNLGIDRRKAVEGRGRGSRGGRANIGGGKGKCLELTGDGA